MSAKLDQQTLNAYLDGELSGREVARIEGLLKSDSEAQQLLDGLRKGTEVLRHSYAPAEIGDVSPALEASVRAMLESAGHSSIKPGVHQLKGRYLISWSHLAGAVAALLVAVLAGYFMAEWQFEKRLQQIAETREKDRQYLEQAVDQALEKQLSGEVTEWRNPESGSHGRIVPVRTFKNRDGQWCREYQEFVAIEGALEERRGIACRSAPGVWQPRLQFLGDS